MGMLGRHEDIFCTIFCVQLEASAGALMLVPCGHKVTNP